MRNGSTPTPWRCAFLCLLLAGCDSKAFEAAPESEWTKATRTHSCTLEQTNKVQSEAKWCNDNTQFLSTYCYGAAIMRNCTEKKP